MDILFSTDYFHGQACGVPPDRDDSESTILLSLWNTNGPPQQGTLPPSSPTTPFAMVFYLTIRKHRQSPYFIYYITYSSIGKRIPPFSAISTESTHEKLSF